jgi:hypothetical protein
LYPRDSVYLGHIGQTRRADDDYATPLFAVLPGEIYGDLTGDGAPEAVLAIRCVTSQPDGMMPEEGSQLLVVTMRPDRSLVGLGYVGIVHAQYPSFKVDSQKLYVQLRYDHSSENSFGHSADDTAFTQVYRWDGTAFQRIAGRASNLNFMGQKDANGSRVRLATILRGADVVCPSAMVSFTFGEATAGAYTLTQGGIVEPVDLDRDGNDELIAGIGCRGPGYQATSVYVFGQGDTVFVPIDVPFANDGGYDVTDTTFDGHTLSLALTLRATGATSVQKLIWTGSRFTPSLGAFRLS